MKNYVFPILYKNTQIWKIYVIDNKTFIEHGTKRKMQTPKPQLSSSYESALKKAQTRWNTQVNRGYSTSTCKSCKILPMMAYEYDAKRLKFPVYLQPKFDGYRCMASNKHLLSLRGRLHSNLDHIQKDIRKLNLPDSIHLDGELWSPSLSLYDIRSILGKKEMPERIKQIQFHVFDMYDAANPEMPFKERFSKLSRILRSSPMKFIQKVDTKKIDSISTIKSEFNKFVKKGFEGLIIRNGNGQYKLAKRSHDVMKMKLFFTAKFEIKGYKEGSGDDKGTVIWEFKCKGSKRTFWGKPMGSRNERREMFKNGAEYIGKSAIVEYFDKDKDGCVTRIKRVIMKK